MDWGKLSWEHYVLSAADRNSFTIVYPSTVTSTETFRSNIPYTSQGGLDAHWTLLVIRYLGDFPACMTWDVRVSIDSNVNLHASRHEKCSGNVQLKVSINSAFCMNYDVKVFICGNSNLHVSSRAKCCVNVNINLPTVKKPCHVILRF